MAQFHLSAKTVSRSTGRSAVAAAAYRAAVALYDDRTGLEHKFSRKGGVLDSFLVAPDGCDWALDRSRLWNSVEAAENRKNSTTAREFVVALPSELSIADSKQLLLAFSRALSDRYCVAVDTSMHSPNPDGDDRNRHGHVLLPTRETRPDGLGVKTRILDDLKTGPLEIAAIRELWATLTNKALQRAGHNISITAKSYATRSAEIEAEAAKVRAKLGAHAWSQEISDKAAILAATPTSHLGHRATALERKAKRDAVESGRVYEPQTEIGQINQQLRDARQEAFDALQSFEIRKSMLKRAREQENEALRAKLRAEKAEAAQAVADAKAAAEQEVARIERERVKAEAEAKAAAEAVARIAEQKRKEAAEIELTRIIAARIAEEAAAKVIADQQKADRIARQNRTEDRLKAAQQPSQPPISTMAPTPTATLPFADIKAENIPAPAVDQARTAPPQRVSPSIAPAPTAKAPQAQESPPTPVQSPIPKVSVMQSEGSVPVKEKEPAPEWPNIWPFTLGGRVGPLIRLYCHVMLNILDLKTELDAPDSQLKRLFRESVRRLGPLLKGIDAWIKSGKPQVDQVARALMVKRPDLNEIEQVIRNWPAPQQQSPPQQAPIGRKGGKGPAD